MAFYLARPDQKYKGRHRPSSVSTQGSHQLYLHQKYLPHFVKIPLNGRLEVLGKENLLFFQGLQLAKIHLHYPPQFQTATKIKQRDEEIQIVKSFFEQYLRLAESKPFLVPCRPDDYFDNVDTVIYHPKKLGHPKNRFVRIKHFEIINDEKSGNVHLLFTFNHQEISVPLHSPFVLTQKDYDYFKQFPREAVAFSANYKRTHSRFDSRQWCEDLKLNTFHGRSQKSKKSFQKKHFPDQIGRYD